MKIVKVDEYNIDIIGETEEYVDIFSYKETYHNDPEYETGNGWIFLDEGKGWKLCELKRIDKNTKQVFDISCDPSSCGYNCYNDIDIKFTTDGVNYHRLIVLGWSRDEVNFVTQEIITSNEEHDMSEEFVKYIEKYNTRVNRYREIQDSLIDKNFGKETSELLWKDYASPNYRKFVDIKSNQSIDIDLENKKYELFTNYEDLSLDDQYIANIEKYLKSRETECKHFPYPTNNLCIAFFEMNSKVKLYGYPNEKVMFFEKNSENKLVKVKKKEIYNIK